LVIPPAVHREVVERGADYPVGKAVRAALGEWISVAPAPDATRVEDLRREYRWILEKLDELRAWGFRLSDQHYEMILEELGESL
jgi:hypothetical protein